MTTIVPIAPRIIAVTGATGFIGRHLVDAHLANGDVVRVLTRRPHLIGQQGAQPFVADLAAAAPARLEDFLQDADVVYHCAGELRDERQMNALHVDGTRSLLEAATGRIGRWIQLSSVGVYGPVRAGVVTEESPIRPVGAYETSKARADSLVDEWSARTGAPSVIIRPTIVIGADMRSPWLHGMLSAVERGLFTYIGRPGASTNYVPVDEVIAALRAAGAAQTTGCEAFNISQWMTMESFIAHAATLLGVRAPTRRIAEVVARAVASTAGRLPSFPLTTSRVDALTSFARYPSERIAERLDYHEGSSILDVLSEIVRRRRGLLA